MIRYNTRVKKFGREINNIFNISSGFFSINGQPQKTAVVIERYIITCP